MAAKRIYIRSLQDVTQSIVRVKGVSVTGIGIRYLERPIVIPRSDVSVY